MWANYTTWDLVLPPSRPDRRELERIRALARAVQRNAPIAILGSTIEFRNLLFQMGFSMIDVIDVNPTFYNWTKNYVLAPHHENFVCSEWIEALENSYEKYALILSDLTVGNIEYERQKDFFYAINHALQKGGLFIDKILLNKVELHTLASIKRRFVREPVNLSTINRFSCEAIFCSVLQRDFGVINTNQIYEALEHSYVLDGLHLLVEACKRVTPLGFVWYYGKNEDATARGYGAGLTLLNQYDMPHGSPYRGRAVQNIFRK